MTSDRKHSFIETVSSGNPSVDDLGSISDKRWRRASLLTSPWMNKIKPFIYGPKSDDTPECYNRVRYIRDSCKVFSDLWKTDKDFLSKSIDSDVSKSFKEFRLSENARNYRSPYGPNGAPSLLNRTIDDLVQIHDYIDSKRKESLDQVKKLIEQAKDKQSTIRQTMTELRDNYEKAQRKLETADANLKKFQTRSDRLTLANFDERCRELEDIRSECEQSRTLLRDIYSTEIYRISSEEHLITDEIFSKYLFEQTHFYNNISKYLSIKIPDIENRLDNDDLTPSFHCDLIKHCSNKLDKKTNVAYPIEICVNLLKNHLNEEGIFRIAPSQIKQKKFVAELDLQLIDKSTTLNELYYDPHVPATTLKQYLRELPDCLLTSTLLTQWNEINSISTEQGRVQRIGQLINQLPKINYDNLSYLVEFLSRVAEHSNENKMTPSNLGICIGCSILYPKDQSSNTALTNSFTSASTILELMIIHHKQLFNNSYQQQQEQSTKSFKSQPDLIPTEFNTKTRSGSNENLLESQNAPVYPQPSPGTRRKAKAPPPPPISSQQSLNEQINTQTIPLEHSISEQASNQYLTGNQSPDDKKTKLLTSKSAEESSQQFSQMKSIYKRFTKVTSSSSFNPSDKVHRRTPSDGSQLDRPGAPPPHPPSVSLVSSSPTTQSKQRHSIQFTNLNTEPTLHSPTEEKILTNDLPTDPTTPTNDNVNVGKLISELNNRMAAAKGNNTQPTNFRASSIRNSTIQSPGETTDF